LAKFWRLNKTNKAWEEKLLRKPVVNLRREYTDNIKKEYNMCGNKVEICAWKVMSNGGVCY
jgi:hypothetical protein